MKVQEYLMRAGVPEKFIGADLANLKFFDENVSPDAAFAAYLRYYQICQKIVADAKVGVLIVGMAGSGKSFLGTAMLREYLRQGRKSARASAAEISDYYFANDYQGYRDRYMLAEVLFIEDITKCGISSQSNTQLLERLIKQRDDTNKITLYSTFKESDIANKFSEDAARLIKGTTFQITLPNLDLRQLVLKNYAKTIM